jgi:NTE family protein
MASASIPLFYNYEQIQGHKFWDGGVLSNTPLREVLQAHRDYWYKKGGGGKADSKVPDLEVYIIGLWPSSRGSAEDVPSDYDGIKRRLYDVGLSDKTEYDEKTATIVSDYIKIIKQIKNFALEHIKNLEQRNAFSNDLDAFLAKEPALSKGRDGGERTYGPLINGRFKLHHEVVRIELKNDRDGISNRAFDLTSITIKNLNKQGEDDARHVIQRVVSKYK